ncbi:hypothetical protein LCM10_16945 [Rossellomorea aquimaris]|uniref:hypothetical protein n=1 Tax=Rossellomorea aquimaris TaxID=189382 RepID=UPI001CD7CDB8|nr:hypothetical protein [Rossellomorea aquimaris]MCA1056673.1 hypothetical protein [Rossellomorea aquimaris]
MPNWVPFIALVIISVGLLGYTLVKNRENASLILLFWLFICGVAYLFEFVIFILLESYEYRPGILISDYNDSIVGSIISQALAVPVAIVFIVVFQIRKRWIFFIIGLFFLIETLFLHLDIYEHHWWKSIYTIFFLVLTIILSKIWWRHLNSKPYHYIHLVTLYLAMMTLTQTAGWILSSLIGLYGLPMGFFDSVQKDMIAGNGLYLFFSTYFYMLNIYYRRNDLAYTIMTLVFLTTIEILMVNQGILRLKNPYSIFVLPALHLVFLQVGKYIVGRAFPEFYQSTEKKTVPS